MWEFWFSNIVNNFVHDFVCIYFIFFIPWFKKRNSIRCYDHFDKFQGFLQLNLDV